jgi:hypothetical protein
MRSCVTDIILEGYPLTDILTKVHDDVIAREDFSDLDKALICDKIAQVISNRRVSSGLSLSLTLLLWS